MIGRTRGPARRLVSAAVASALGLGAAMVGGGAAVAAGTAAPPTAVPADLPAAALAAAPGNPGEPGEPEVLYTEDFENTPDGSNVLLPQYTGASGTTYAAAAFWANRPNCNGFIVDWTSPRTRATAPT